MRGNAGSNNPSQSSLGHDPSAKYKMKHQLISKCETTKALRLLLEKTLLLLGVLGGVLAGRRFSV